MANKELFNKDKKKRNAREFKDLEELKEKQIVKIGDNKEIAVIHPVKEKGEK